MGKGIGLNIDTEKTFNTLIEGAWMTGGAIAGAKWIDRNTLFATNIAADPTFVNTFQYMHWGGIVAAGAAWGSTMIENEYAKLALIGLCVWGLLEEARQNFGGATPGANWAIMGPAEQELDQKLRQAAMGLGIPSKYGAGVGAKSLPVADLPMAYGIPGTYQAGVGFSM